MNVLDSVFARFYDRLTDPMERKGLADQRRQLLGALSGSVLEVGAGTGRNLEFYPAAVTSLTLTEPAPAMISRLRAEAAKRRPDAIVVEAPAESLPFDDGAFDAVVTTLVLCSVGDLQAAARELRRVVRAEGQLVVVEHVATAGGPSLPQRLWNPAQKVLGRHCHLTRNTRAALEGAGFDTAGLMDTTLPGAPPAMFPVIMGVATPAAV